MNERHAAVLLRLADRTYMSHCGLLSTMPSLRILTALRTLAIVLAIALLALVTAPIALGGPQLYPAWPTVGPVPVSPELVVPGLLGAVVIGTAFAEGRTVSSVATGGLGALTLALSMVGLYVLFAGAGGPFFFGLFSLAAGVLLAVVVLVRGAIRQRD